MQWNRWGHNQGEYCACNEDSFTHRLSTLPRENELNDETDQRRPNYYEKTTPTKKINTTKHTRQQSYDNSSINRLFSKKLDVTLPLGHIIIFLCKFGLFLITRDYDKMDKVDVNSFLWT